MLGTWPLTVGAVLYFAYAVAVTGAALYAYLARDPRMPIAFAALAVALGALSAGLALAMLRAKRGKTSWLVWLGGTAGTLAGFSAALVGWVSAAVIVLPLLFGMLGLSRAQNDG